MTISIIQQVPDVEKNLYFSFPKYIILINSEQFSQCLDILQRPWFLVIKLQIINCQINGFNFPNFSIGKFFDKNREIKVICSFIFRGNQNRQSYSALCRLQVRF